MTVMHFRVLVLCVAAAVAIVVAPPAARSAQDAYDEFDAATEKVRVLISFDKLKDAEGFVQTLEPKFAGMWNLGRFGFEARMQIGEAYFRRGDVAEALRLFNSAQPGGGCGNCMDSQYVRRNLRVAGIYESRLNYPAALATYLDAFPNTDLGAGRSEVTLGILRSGGACASSVLALAYLFFLLLKWRRKRTEESVVNHASLLPDLHAT